MLGKSNTFRSLWSKSRNATVWSSASKTGGVHHPVRLFHASSSISEEASVGFSLADRFETHNIDGLPDETSFTKSELLEYYETMYTMRRLEIACDLEYKAQTIKGFCHLYDGQEAIAMGMKAALTYDDPLITSYRCHCHQLARGDTPEKIFAELMGKGTGSVGGKGGSMHLYKADANFYGGAAIVGAQVPVGAGLGFACKYNCKEGEKMNTAFAMYGDGAANQGQAWEAANMAKIWGLPICFIIENNQYGMGTSVERSSANTEYFKQGGVVIPGIKCDGMNVLAVREAIRFVKDYCGAGKGPIYLEFNTYRYHGHSMTDPGVTYRSREEVDTMRQDYDPVNFVKTLLLDNDMSDADEIKAIEKRVRGDIKKAVKKAKADSEPNLETLCQDIYSNGEGGSEVPDYIRMPDVAKSVTK